ncbi:MAG: TatD family hydrolase [Paramuribaculum sp.]|nr:TatD family hydrolase [Paramuribaculum sp.]
MLIDTHTHLYLPEFDIDGGGEAAVRRALDAGVEHMIFPNVDLTSIEPMRLLHAKFPESTSMAMGLHPTEVGESWRDDLAQVEEELRSHRHDYVAVGEIGIDLYWDKTFAEQQMQVLERQMLWAQEMNLPVIIHCREGLDQTLEVLQGFGSSRGVMHSFGGTPEDVERIRSVVDYHFGINGIVTFKNSKLRDTLPAITLDRLLLETDSPYLAPVPHRGKRNESAYIVATASVVAQALGVAPQDVAAATSANARGLFGI